MKQQSLATAGFDLSPKRIRKREFIDEMNLMVPRADLVCLVQPDAQAARTGRPPFATETMLHIHFMKHWFGLSDSAVEEGQHDAPVSARSLASTLA